MGKKKNEGASATVTTSPAGNTTKDSGVSTALESPVEGATVSNDGPIESNESVERVAENAPVVTDNATGESAEEAVPVSRRGDGTTEGGDAENEEPASVRIPGLPAEVTLDDLRDLGIPAPGTVLTCAVFETGAPVEGVVTKISVELDVVNVWLRGSGWTWPIPVMRIDGATWIHAAEDYPDPTTSESFDRLHRTPTDPPENVPAGWLPAAPVAKAVPKALPAEARPVVVQIDEKPAAAPLVAAAPEATAQDQLRALTADVRARHAEKLAAFFGNAAHEITDHQVVLYMANVLGVAMPKDPPKPKVRDPLHTALGIPDHYTLCEIKGHGSISGHGIRASDGVHREEHAGGTHVYFPDTTVRKLGHMLETDPAKFTKKRS